MTQIKTYLSTLMLPLLLLTTVELSTTGCAARVVYVRKAPPPPRVEVRPPRPAVHAVWIPGHWRWNGHAYVWVAGRWNMHPKGKVWVPGHWKKTRHGYRWIPGHWRR